MIFCMTIEPAVFFGDELIMGSYTFRVLLLIIPLSLYFHQNNVYFKNFLKLILLTIVLIYLLILSGERVAFYYFDYNFNFNFT